MVLSIIKTILTNEHVYLMSMKNLFFLREGFFYFVIKQAKLNEYVLINNTLLQMYFLPLFLYLLFR